METKELETSIYLLRLWQVKDGSVYTWRASLQDVQTQERHVSADIRDLLAFLEEVVRPTGFGRTR